MKHFTRTQWLAVLLVGITLAIFWRVGRNDFVNYDDPDYVTANRNVQAGLTWEGVKWAFGNLHGQATYWHPITWLSHMLDCQLFGLNATAHHLINLFFHTINAVLLFVILNRLTTAPWRSFIIAAIFAIHPLQVDTVAWVTERKNVLSGLFWMLSVLAYVRYVSQRTLPSYALVLLCFVLGLMTKPILVTLPAVLLLLDIWPLRRLPWTHQNLPASNIEGTDVPSASLKTLLVEKLPLLVLAIASSAVTILSHAGLGISQASHGLPVQLRIENAFVSYAGYLGKFVAPTNLAVLYPHPGKWPAEEVWMGILLIAAITALVGWQFRRRPFLLIGWLWFLAVMLPAVGLLQIGIQAMADRFMYLPIIGLLIAIVFTGAEIVRRFGKNVAVSLTILALSACAILSSLQLRHWKNSLTLWQHTVEVTKDNWVALNNFAHTLYLAGQYDEGIERASESLRIRPDFAEARLNLALLIEAKGRPEEAILHYRRALAIHSNWPLARKHLADALARTGNATEAMVHYDATVAMVPSDIEARSKMASLLTQQGKSAEAIAQYREALRYDPERADVLNNLAWLLATDPRPDLRNPSEAVLRAARACELTKRKQPLFIGTLAAALAANGQFDEAVQTAEEAATLARLLGLPELEATNQRLKKLYSERKTYGDVEPLNR
jgi:protein O-mannosyl-transferase